MKAAVQYTIRFGSINDLQNYTRLLQKTYEFAYTNEKLGLTKSCFSSEIFATTESQEYLRSHLINTHKQKTWLMFENSTLIGSITCALKNAHEAEISGFYINPMYQGKGMGKKLYNVALKFAGNRNLLLDIYVHNTKSIRMYEKWGWRLDPTRGDEGYFYRHWKEWPEGLQAKCMYMKFERKCEYYRNSLLE